MSQRSNNLLAACERLLAAESGTAQVQVGTQSQQVQTGTDADGNPIFTTQDTPIYDSRTVSPLAYIEQQETVGADRFVTQVSFTVESYYADAPSAHDGLSGTGTASAPDLSLANTEQARSELLSAHWDDARDAAAAALAQAMGAA